MNENIFKNSSLFQDIDKHFANYICKMSDTNDFKLWLIAAFVSYYANNGHSLFDIATVNNKLVSDVFEIDDNNENADLKIPNLTLSDKFTNAIGSNVELKPLIFDNGCYYLNRYYQYELSVSSFIRKRVNIYNDISESKDDINIAFPKNEISGMINWQKIAAILAMRAKFAVISGGPGTGKTTTIGKVLTLLLKQNPDLRIKLVAPTGKAADRLNESIKKFKQDSDVDKKILENIPETAETIHRFLGIYSKKLKFDKFSNAPIDLLLIDEASMVSLPLFAKTFEALSDECRVILLGDKDQLAAVENGNVLKDITSSNNINSFSAQFADCVSQITDNKLSVDISKNKTLIEDCTVHLEYSWRFNSESGIGELSKFINNSDEKTNKEDLINLFAKYDDINIEDLEINDFLKSFCQEHLVEYKRVLNSNNIAKSFETLSKYRVLCALNDSDYGVKNVNKMIEKYLFNNSLSTNFYHGQPILITVNDYNLNLMNGDVGIILKDNNNELKAYFKGKDNEFIDISPSNLGGYTTAFAISIHKSQGSEFDNIFIVLPKKDNRILTKELIYTAVTRAKKTCSIISNNSLLFDVSIRRILRQSGLTKRIK